MGAVWGKNSYLHSLKPACTPRTPLSPRPGCSPRAGLSLTGTHTCQAPGKEETGSGSKRKLLKPKQHRAL